MAIITSQVKLTPLATGSLPSGTEGAIAYDSTTDEVKTYGTAWTGVSAGLGPNEGGTMRTYQHGGTGTTYQVHIFDNPGLYLFKLIATKSCDVLMVGGGGSGGNGLGGGGAGGVVAWCTGKSVAAGTYSVYVGQGGSASWQTGMANCGGVYGEASWIQGQAWAGTEGKVIALGGCLLYTSPSPRDRG